MKTRVILAITLLGVALVGYLLWSFGGQVRERNEKAIAKAAQVSASSPVVNAPLPSHAPNAPAVPVAGPGAQATPPPDRDFQNWLVNEAKQVDSTHVDSGQKQREIAKIIATLTPNQARQLLQTAVNPASSAGERILSTYLLVEGGAKSRAELQNLIATPLAFKGPQEIHSENETRSVQERAQRVMAVDGLVSQARQDPSAREALAQTISTIQDPYIRGYADKQLHDLQPH